MYAHGCVFVFQVTMNQYISSTCLLHFYTLDT